MAAGKQRISREFRAKAAPIEVRTVLDRPVHIVDGSNSRSLALLQRAYNGVYMDAFPIEEERMSLNGMVRKLRGDDPTVIGIVVISGENLDSAKPVIKGIAIANYYPAADAGLMLYNAVGEAFRGEGLGRVLYEIRRLALAEKAEQQGKKLSGIFVHCNDPQKISPEQDSIDPAARIRTFEKWGARMVDIECLLPPLEPGAAACDYLKLLAYPHPKTGQYPDRQAIKAYINAIYRDLAPGTNPEDNPDYHNVLKQVDALTVMPTNKNNGPKLG